MLSRDQKDQLQPTYVARNYATIKQQAKDFVFGLLFIYTREAVAALYTSGMLFLSILHHYLWWHYTRAFGEILHVAKNFYWFLYHFFSLPQLTRSFFAPWKRMTEARGDTFSFEDLASFIIIGLISRLIGMVLRGVIIIAGLAALLLLTAAVVATYLFWLFAPLLLVASLYYGLVLLFS